MCRACLRSLCSLGLPGALRHIICVMYKPASRELAALLQGPRPAPLCTPTRRGSVVPARPPLGQGRRAVRRATQLAKPPMPCGRCPVAAVGVPVVSWSVRHPTACAVGCQAHTVQRAPGAPCAATAPTRPPAARRPPGARSPALLECCGSRAVAVHAGPCLRWAAVPGAGWWAAGRGGLKISIADHQR